MIGSSEAAALGLHVDGGSGGALIDDEAKTAYRARLRELQVDLDEAVTTRYLVVWLTSLLSVAVTYFASPVTEVIQSFTL